MANFHYLPANTMSRRYKMSVHKKGGINAAIKYARANIVPEVGDLILSFHRMFKAGEKLGCDPSIRDGIVARAVEIPQDESHPLWGKEEVVWQKIMPTWKTQSPVEIDIHLMDDDPLLDDQ